MAEIIWSALAKEHLREIDAYISKGSPFYSIIFIDKLIASVEKNRIVYSIQGDDVTILAIVHGAMDIKKNRERDPWDVT